MRDLTKNAFRFSWSLSLFGVQQMVNLLRPTKASGAFENTSEAIERELEGTIERVFRAGDALQSDLVDATLGGIPGRLGGRLPGAPRASVPEVTSWAEVPSSSSPAPSPRPTSSAPSSSTQTPSTQTSSALSSSTPAPTPRPAGAKGWGPIPYPVVVPRASQPSAPPGGGASPPQLVTETNVSPDYPFAANYAEVLDSKMHYVEVGSGDPILILHGNPSWSYIWRNIIPHLEPLGRCIAPDLIGFGRSDKPDIPYRWSDHVRYLEAFIEKMGLRNITLVLHDQGSGLGFHYAMRNESNVKALAFFEAILRPYPWDSFSTPDYRELFRQFRSGGVGGPGWQMIVEQNMFIEQLLPQAAGRPLSEKEMDFYREPFVERMSRVPIWQFPRQTPIGGEPPDVWEAVSKYSERLQRSQLPKLLLYARPGALVTEEHLEWAKQSLPNLETFYVGDGLHFLQESSPTKIGSEIARWIRGLGSKS